MTDERGAKMSSTSGTRASRSAASQAREPDPADVRGTLLHLTDQGDQAVAILRARLEPIIATARNGWEPQRAATFADDLRLVVTALLS